MLISLILLQICAHWHLIELRNSHYFRNSYPRNMNIVKFTDTATLQQELKCLALIGEHLLFTAKNSYYI